MYRSNPLRSTLNTGYNTALDMCEVCTEAVHSVALWTQVTSQLWTRVKYVQKQSIPLHLEHGLHRRFGHVWSMYRSSPLRSTLNTGYITALDMCEVCTEAVHFVALSTRLHHSFGHVWSMYRCSPFRIRTLTRTSSQVWACVKYVPKLSIAKHFKHECHHRFGQTCVKFVPKQSIP